MAELIKSKADSASAQRNLREYNQNISCYIFGLKDFFTAVQKYNVWLLLAWHDIKLRYRRSKLGPFWVTISMAVTVYSIGFFYGKIMHVDLKEYYPFLASGMLAWNLISNLIIESSNIFIESEYFIRQIKQPYFLFIFKTIVRNFIIFLHNILVYIPIAILFKINYSWHLVMFLYGMFILLLNGVFYGSILAMLGARFRDFPQLLNSLIQVIFFMSPIMWLPTSLPAKYSAIVYYNPFCDFINLVRNPMLGIEISNHTYIVSGLITVFGLFLSIIFFSRYRAKIIYWL